MTAQRTYIGIGIVVGIVALAVLWSLFRPDLLFVNTAVNEAAPAALVAAPQAAPIVDATAAAPAAAASSATQAALPAAAADVAPTVPALAAQAAQPVTWSASFQSLAHETKGTADIRVLADGSKVLRFEGFATSNGPDVRVYLVRGNDGTQDDAIKAGDFIDLGALKGNVGDQNYVLPADVDLSEYQSVSLWCRRFSVNFGGTKLS